MTATPGFRPKRAIVLSAGLGKRMRPITATTPKPLIEVAGRSLIDHSLDRLAEIGVEQAIVNVHYLADLVEVHVGRRSEPKITISDERDQLLETGGAVKKVLPQLQGEAFLLLNSDSTWVEGVRPNLALLCDRWDPEHMDILLMLAPVVSCTGYSGLGDFEMDQAGRLSRRASQRMAPFAYAGALIMNPALFNDAPEGKFSLNVLFDQTIRDGRLFGMRMEGFWLHIGTPDAIKAAENAIELSAV